VLRHNGFSDPTAPAPPVDVTAPPPPISPHMVVFRNQQGLFLPGMSDGDELQYWRLLKADAGAAVGEHIKEGDKVRLCWAFADQTTGFRDYMDDVFGRRRRQCPPELQSSVLFLKVPFPRFENRTLLDEGVLPPPNSMLMAPEPSTETQWMGIRTLPALAAGTPDSTYAIQDVTFRIDLVGETPYGDTGDFMMKDIAQDGVRFATRSTLQLFLNNSPMFFWWCNKMFYF